MSKVICPVCGKRSATVHAPKAYHYVESGLPNLWLHGGVTETECPECGEEALGIKKEGQLLQVIAMALLMSPHRMTGPEMRFVRCACRMSQAELAESLSLPRRATVAERERKEDPGLSFAAELGLRVVLVRTFLDYLSLRRNSLLSAAQVNELRGFAHNFFEFSKLASKKLKKSQLKATLQDNWRLKRAA